MLIGRETPSSARGTESVATPTVTPRVMYGNSVASTETEIVDIFRHRCRKRFIIGALS